MTSVWRDCCSGGLGAVGIGDGGGDARRGAAAVEQRQRKPEEELAAAVVAEACGPARRRARRRSPLASTWLRHSLRTASASRRAASTAARASTITGLASMRPSPVSTTGRTSGSANAAVRMVVPVSRRPAPRARASSCAVAAALSGLRRV